MHHLRKLAWNLSGLLALAPAQFVPPPTDLTSTTGHANIPVRYKEVPAGTCEFTPGVKSYSGYVDIDSHQHLFFWFFEARNQDPTTAPLTLWINGGPGASSMLGLFSENGPCRVEYGGTLVNNPYSWNNVSNMIYIDQPTTTGLSYSIPVPAYRHGFLQVQLPNNTCPPGVDRCGTYPSDNLQYTANSTRNGAEDLWKALQGFMGAFPQYSNNGFHFATESYGGHYGPVYSEYIVEQNSLIDAGQLDAHHIDLRSLLIGNGWYDPRIQYLSYYNFGVEPGNTYDVVFASEEVRKRVHNAFYGAGNCYDMIGQCYLTGRGDICSSAGDFCYFEVQIPSLELHRNIYDIREVNPDSFPPPFYVHLLNTPEMQQALGLFVNYSDVSTPVNMAFTVSGDDSSAAGTIIDCKKLVDHGVYMVQYSGDSDFICNWYGNQAVVEEIDPPGLANAGFENVSTSDAIVHGVVKQSANFAFVRIYEAGHEVPFYQPLISLEMLHRVLNGFNVATGTVQVAKGSSYKTSRPAQSTYREGNSTVQYEPLPRYATYNTTTNQPNPVNNQTSRRRDVAGRQRGKPW